MLRAEDTLRLGRQRFTAYLADEVYYDWRKQHWTVNQATVGLTYPFAGRFSGEVYYIRQSVREASDINIYGLAFTARLNQLRLAP